MLIVKRSLERRICEGKTVLLILSYAQYVNRWFLAHEQSTNQPDGRESPRIEAGACKTLAHKGGISKQWGI